MDLQLSKETDVTRSAWSHWTIGWLTLLFGIPNGLILASINWFRLGLSYKAILHLTLGILSLLLFIIFGTHIEWLSDHKTIQIIIFFALYLFLTFLVSVYLDRQTKKDIENLPESGGVYKKAHWGSALVILLFLILFSGILRTTLIEYRLATYQNHIYCEVLQPGLTQDEVKTALAMEAGSFEHGEIQEIPESVPTEVKSLFMVTNPDKDQLARLWLGLGYNAEGKLIWISQLTINGLQEINCP